MIAVLPLCRISLPVAPIQGFRVQILAIWIEVSRGYPNSLQAAIEIVSWIGYDGFLSHSSHFTRNYPDISRYITCRFDKAQLNKLMQYFSLLKTITTAADKSTFNNQRNLPKCIRDKYWAWLNGCLYLII